MKLTRDELGVLLNYYTGLKFDLEGQIDILKENCQGMIDHDLYKIQLNRYKTKLEECLARANELGYYKDNC